MPLCISIELAIRLERKLLPTLSHSFFASSDGVHAYPLTTTGSSVRRQWLGLCATSYEYTYLPELEVSHSELELLQTVLEGSV